MKKYLKPALKILLVPFSIAVLSVMVIGLYQPGKVLLFGDTDLTYHFASRFFSFDKIYIWNDYFQSGSFDLLKFQAFYLKKLIYLCNIAIHNLSLFSYLWYFVPIFLFGLTFYFLVSTVLRRYSFDKKRALIIALVISLLSFMNGIFMLYVGQALFIAGLIFANIFLIIFFKNLKHIEKYGKNNLLLMILSGLVVSESLIYLQIDILIIYSLALLLLFNFRFFLKYWKQFVFWGVVIGFITACLNAQWLLVLASQMIHKSGGVADLSVYDPNLGWKIAKGISPNIYFQELLRLKSYHMYNSSAIPILLLGYIPFFLVVINLSKFKKDILMRNCMILALVALYLGYGIKGINEFPLYFLWKVMPFFSTFRTVMKFHFIYLYAFLIILSIVLTKINSKVIFYILSALLVGSALTSLYYYNQAEFRRNMQMYQIPEYYSTLEKMNLDQNDKKVGSVMLLPQTNWQYQYEWAPAKIDSMNVFPYFYGSGDLINGAQYEADAAFAYNDEFNMIMRSGDRTAINSYLSAKNVKYIVYQGDARIPNDETLPANLKTRPPLDKKLPLEDAKNILNDEVCESSFQVGELYFCKVHNTVFMPVFSFAKNDSGAVVEFKKINPTKYRLIIHHLTQSEILQFAQSYHADWAVYPDTVSQDVASPNYQKLAGNETDQATQSEITNYIDRGFLSKSGGSAFVSKLIRGSIQNDNLETSSYNENWGKSPIISDAQLTRIANSLNGWEISNQLCDSNTSFCKTNSDGSHDIYLSVELRSQKYLIMGLWISIGSFFIIIGLLAGALLRKRVNECSR